MKINLGLGSFFYIALKYLCFPNQIFVLIGLLFIIFGFLSSNSYFPIGSFFIGLSLCVYFWNKQSTGVGDPDNRIPFYKEKINWGNIFSFIFWVIFSAFVGYYIVKTNYNVNEFLQIIKNIVIEQ
jgi:hypothetical protein